MDTLIVDSSTLVTGIGWASLFLAAGVALGLWVGTSFANRSAEDDDSEQFVQLVGGLLKWANGVAGDMSDYRDVVAGVSQRLAAAPQEGLDRSSAHRLLAALLEANEIIRTRLESAEAKLKRQAKELAAYMSEARTDALTGLPNRRAFDDELSRRLAERHRYGTPLAVLLLDIDFFKRFNDQHGHQAGDSVLSDVGQLLRSTARAADMICRYGGEEFAMILPHTNEDECREAVERIRRVIEKAKFVYAEQPLQVTISCGAACPLELESFESLLGRADKGLYASKNAGRNFAHFHDGRRTVPITLVSAARRVPNCLEPDTQKPAELSTVCDNLRLRLSELAESFSPR